MSFSVFDTFERIEKAGHKSQNSTENTKGVANSSKAHGHGGYKTPQKIQGHRKHNHGAENTEEQNATIAHKTKRRSTKRSSTEITKAQKTQACHRKLK